MSWMKLAALARKRPRAESESSSGKELSDSLDASTDEYDDLDSDGDGLPDPVAGEDDSEEEIKVFDVIDEATNTKRLNNKKTYRMKPLPGRVGLKINAAVRYFNRQSQDFF